MMMTCPTNKESRRPSFIDPMYGEIKCRIECVHGVYVCGSPVASNR